MTGTGDRMFSPDDAVTRGMIAQILYAAEGKPSGDSPAGFRDVPDGMWYSDAVNWCVSAGLAAGYTGKDTSANGDLSRYPDAGEVRDYAVTAMKWAVGHRLITGTGKGLEPRGTATRAQVAVILQAFDRL